MGSACRVINQLCSIQVLCSRRLGLSDWRAGHVTVPALYNCWSQRSLPKKINILNSFNEKCKKKYSRLLVSRYMHYLTELNHRKVRFCRTFMYMYISTQLHGHSVKCSVTSLHPHTCTIRGGEMLPILGEKRTVKISIDLPMLINGTLSNCKNELPSD